MLVHSSSVSQAFIDKVLEMSIGLNINPNWLMVVMEHETTGTFDPTTTNTEGHTGLILFTQTMAEDVGTTLADLALMTDIQQLDYVYKYLNRYRAKIKSLVDLYLAIFFPLAIGKHQSWIIETPKFTAKEFRDIKPTLDINNDSKIQIWEIKQALLNRTPVDYKYVVI